jgi:hypothetical protein
MLLRSQILALTASYQIFLLSNVSEEQLIHNEKLHKERFRRVLLYTGKSPGKISVIINLYCTKVYIFILYFRLIFNL